MEYEFHKIAGIFPLIEGDEFKELVEDIRKHGQIDPIWLYEGKILDGRNRYRACREAGVEPKVEQYTGDDPVGFSWSKNTVRRQLTPSQRATAVAAMAPLLKAEAKKRQGKRTDLLPNLAGSSNHRDDADGGTRATVARMAGVSPTMAGAAMALTEKAKTDPEAQAMVEKVKRGEVTVNAATAALKGDADVELPVVLLVDGLIHTARTVEKSSKARLSATDFDDYFASVGAADWKGALRAAKWFSDNGQVIVDAILKHAKETPPQAKN